MRKMGQYDIYRYLELHKGKWYSSHELAENLGIGWNSANCCLKRLRKFGFIDSRLKIIKSTHGQRQFQYRFKDR